MAEVEQLLFDRAAAMAAHDGVPVAVVHIHGAANLVQAELLSGRDSLIGLLLAGQRAKPAAVVVAAPLEVTDQPDAGKGEAVPPAADAVDGETIPPVQADAEPAAAEEPVAEQPAPDAEAPAAPAGAPEALTAEEPA